MDEIESQTSWSLGDDDDCETCGSSWNTARFESEPEETWKWQFSYSVGCYGGEYVMGDDENWESKLEEMFNDLARYPLWDEDIENQIRQMIKTSTV